MKLYHGSNIEVKNPKILTSARVGDFGRGFYTTSSLEQARRWAQIRAKQEDVQSGIVTVFEVPDTIFENSELRIKTFEKADEEWLDFVLENRISHLLSYTYFPMFSQPDYPCSSSVLKSH